MQNSTELTGQTYVYSDRAQFSSLTALLHWVTHNSTALLYRPTATPHNSLALLHCCIELRTILQPCCTGLQRHHTIL